MVTPYQFHERIKHNRRRLKLTNRDPLDPFVDENTEYGTVTYERPAPDGFVVTGLIATLDAPQQNVDFVPTLAITKIEYLSFIFDVEDLTTVGAGGPVPFLPETGDVISRGDGSRYRVISFGEGESVYQYITNNKDRLRVFTQLVGLVAVATGGPAGVDDSNNLAVNDLNEIAVP